MSAVEITRCGPLCSLQDAGRMGYLRYGVTESGPMDRHAFSVLAAALDSADRPEFTAIEVSLGGLSLTANQRLTLGFCGGSFQIDVDQLPLSSWGVFTLEPGQTLTVRPGPSGSWGYLSTPGGFAATPWLGSRSAHLPSGRCGGMLGPGALLHSSETTLRTDLNCALPSPEFARFQGDIRVVTGPQDNMFSSDSLRALFASEFTVRAECDRMGMRLNGAALLPENALSIPSEAIIRGSLQVPGHGDPIVLLADHQTTGGYPKIATVIACDQDIIAQLRPGDTLRFTEVSVEQAINATRARAHAVANYISEIPALRGSLAEKLGRVNLISGMVGPDDAG